MVSKISTNSLKDWVFKRIHTSQLVYNTCWEDPRCDRQLLDFQKDSEIVMITSAGCNALAYNLDAPKAIHCIDMNTRQNALLELKRVCIKELHYRDFYRLFGEGMHPYFKEVYFDVIQPKLSEEARNYWDSKYVYFDGKGIRKSFYYYGSSGTVAWMFKQYLKGRKKLRQNIEALMRAESMEKQIELYEAIDPQLVKTVFKWLMNQHVTMSMIGVPRDQQLLFQDQYEHGALGYLQMCLRRVFTQLPVQDNYFWRVYMEGQYTPDCCPEYIKPENTAKLQANDDHIHQYTTTISDFLKQHPKAYSHYILLDHQDWMAVNAPEALEEEWQLILKNSKPGTKILMRSAAEEITFFPEFVKERVHFETEKVEEVQKGDRVGTYASTYLLIVK